MYPARLIWMIPLILALSLIPLAASARTLPPGPGPAEGAGLAPYFLVSGEDDGQVLPLESTRARVSIAGVIARVTLTQVYTNPGPRPLEAVYVFPASTKAAVHGLTMRIGQRTITAKIERRQEARAEYEAAKAQGRTASLLEQERPNVFTMNVAGIQPGDRIAVELTYSELLAPKEGRYRFVLPTVVGPRYPGGGGGVGGGEAWVANPYLPQGRAAAFDFGLELDLACPLPIAKLACPSHAEAQVTFDGKREARVSLPPSPQAGNRDVVVEYALAGEAIQAGALIHRAGEGGHFLVMVEPPQRFLPTMALPREYLFIVDVSGSMRGFPLEIAHRLMDGLLGGMGPSDRFNLLLFAGDSQALAPEPLAATPANRARAAALLQGRSGGGGTELLPALARALALPRAQGMSRSVVLISDGYVRVEKEAFDLVRANLGEANLFCLGVGSSVNRFLIEGLARAGRGEALVALGPEQARAQAERLGMYLRAPVLTDIRVEAEGLEISDLEPARLPDLFARRPLYLLGRFSGPPRGRIVLTGRSAEGPWRTEVELGAERAADHPALPLLWARERVARLADRQRLAPDDARVQEVTRLGLAHGLLTDYTSFVAIDSLVRGQGQPVTVRQPLPLPAGVPNSAVGGRVKAMMAAAPLAQGPRRAAHDAAAPPPPSKVAEERKTEESVRSRRLAILEMHGSCDRRRLRAALESALAQPMRRARSEGLRGRVELLIAATPEGRVGVVLAATADLGGGGDRRAQALAALLQGLEQALNRDRSLGSGCRARVRLDLD